MIEPGDLLTGRKPTITISRQLGCLGHEIVQATADLLGYQIAWRDVINQAASRAGSPQAALAAIDDLGLLGICPSPKECLAYRNAVKQVMEELADQGGVIIVGRAGQVILHDRPAVLHVRLIARADVRARRVAARQNIQVECAQAQIEASDRSRRTYLKRFYQARWDDPELYDLVINTERITADGAALLIKQALTQLYLGSHA